uniref:protein Wnt-10b-like n=1 Tax=Styela clava TaxID=7725 RepID=UPI001939447C|nr:protein Wnt-10b-like [Styela clava]
MIGIRLGLADLKKSILQNILEYFEDLKHFLANFIMTDGLKWRTSWIYVIFYLISLRRFGLPAYNRDRTNEIMRLNIPKTQFRINTNTICGNTEGLTRSQYQLCREDPNAIASAIQGMQIAIHECKRQFKNERWNCTALETKNKIPHTSAFFKTGFREAAFSHAISSAGITYAVAHACSLGKIEACECDLSPNMYSKGLSASFHKNVLKNGGNISGIDPRMKKYIWGGCDHNINFGIMFSRKFLDEGEVANDFHTKLMLHNNRVGRLVVANNMKNRCKCHGTSGTCSLQTCWKQTPNIEFIGNALKELYFKASRIEFSNKADSSYFDFEIRNQFQHMDNNIHYHDPDHNFGVGIDNLIYFKDSPDYCEDDKNIGYRGTRGRYCNRTAGPDSPSSCSNLCCNRGHRTYKHTRVERCSCRFHWCCYVNCENCTITERVSVCR